MVYCVGSALKKCQPMLKTAALIGLLTWNTSNGVNLVSAAAHVKKAGVQVVYCYSLIT